MSDPFVSLMAAGAVTENLKLGTGVCLILERDLIATAKTTATLDRLTDGRLIMGVGCGWRRGGAAQPPARSPVQEALRGDARAGARPASAVDR